MDRYPNDPERHLVDDSDMTQTERNLALESQIQDLETQLAVLRRQLSETELDQWRGRIDDLEVQVHLASLDTRDVLAPMIEDLRNAWLDAREMLSDSATTATDVAGTLRDGLEQAMADIRSAVLEARSRVGD